MDVRVLVGTEAVRVRMRGSGTARKTGEQAGEGVRLAWLYGTGACSRHG